MALDDTVAIPFPRESLASLEIRRVYALHYQVAFTTVRHVLSPALAGVGI